MKKRVVVAMSGGVDSSVAAALLKSQGYEVIGITMCFNLPDSKTKRPTCCGLEAIEDAKRVAYKLGIRHYVLNFSKILEEAVIEDFCQEYLKGRTPNPCVRCNQYIKFGALLKKACLLGTDFLATGHYARIEKEQRPKSKEQNYLLKKGRDLSKDQSYFLYRLNQRLLKNILFPLGSYTKDQVRSLARKFGLAVAEKIGSQEICFIPDNDYRAFLSGRFKEKIKPGKITDKEGNLLTSHNGICFYTIGQRQGLGIAHRYPLYVTRIDKINNQIVVGEKKDTLAKEFYVKTPHFILRPIKNRVVLKVKIRYNHKETEAQILPFKKGLKVIFDKSQSAVTPGQSAVFYDKDRVIGGGIIEIS
jgi:tRNA-specific 2-thiouridylase